VPNWAAIKTEMGEILEIVKMCPEPLQEKCFDILVTSLVRDEAGAPRPHTNAHKDNTDDQPVERQRQDSGEEIAEADLHTKVRKFLVKESISLETLNELYYKEDGDILPLYETPGTHKMAEAQIRLALLTAFENALPTGDFSFNVETVRTRCQAMKCYDSANFAANFRNSASFFQDFTYKKGADGELSPEGKKELASAIKHLSEE